MKNDSTNRRIPRLLLRAIARLMVTTAPDGLDLFSPCRIWPGSKTEKGYGIIVIEGRRRRVHRVLWEIINGSVPEGLVLDHLCRRPACANPYHLEAVTSGENTRRGLIGLRSALRTHCPQGHEYSTDNLRPNRPSRECRICHRTQTRELPSVPVSCVRPTLAAIWPRGPAYNERPSSDRSPEGQCPRGRAPSGAIPGGRGARRSPPGGHCRSPQD